MTSTTAMTLEEKSIPPTLSEAFQATPATVADVEMQPIEELLPPEVTSNIRQGSPSPEPPCFNEDRISYRLRAKKAVPVDPMFALPPPDLAPRFVFNPDSYDIDEPTPISTPSDVPDTALQVQTPAYRPSTPPPRIYFAPSAISFIPPLSYDFLARDPSVKSAPRNYRAWARTGRPKMDLDGAERADAKRDLLAMGRPFPHDGESDDEGVEGEGDKKKRRKKKKTAKALMVPIERPRRMVRKIVEAESPAPAPLQKKRINETKQAKGEKHEAQEKDKREQEENARKEKEREEKEEKEREEREHEQEKAQKAQEQEKEQKEQEQDRQRKEQKKDEKLKAAPPVPNGDARNGATSKLIAQSDSSGRRSSSTLLDTDVAEPSKRKRSESAQVNENHRPKKQRLSRRLHAKKYGPQEQTMSPAPASEEERERSQSPLSELTPSPEPRASSTYRETPVPSERRRVSSPAPSRPGPSKIIAKPSRSATAGPSRLPNVPASRPGHRLSRDALPIQPQAVPMRTFPTYLPVISGYSAFYRRYPLVTQFDKDDPVAKHINDEQDDSQPKRSLGNWNPPRDYRDLYTPRYTKGSGNKKIALCPLCYEEPARGGEGRQEWNHTKTSQHNYHMQYYHGVSATRCAPFSPPISQRTVGVPRPQTNEKSEILQGKCHVCKQWIPLEGCKVGELKVKELLWWKHAAHCHKDSKLAGEADIFLEDEAYRRLKEYEVANPSQD